MDADQVWNVADVPKFVKWSVLVTTVNLHYNNSELSLVRSLCLTCYVDLLLI